MRTIMPVMRLWSKIRYLVATTGDPVEPKIIPQQPTTPLFFWSVMPIAYAMAFIAAMVLYVTVERPFSLEKMNKVQPQVQPEVREYALSKSTD